jgi:hypothetical protein
MARYMLEVIAFFFAGRFSCRLKMCPERSARMSLMAILRAIHDPVFIGLIARSSSRWVRAETQDRVLGHTAEHRAIWRAVTATIVIK